MCAIKTLLLLLLALLCVFHPSPLCEAAVCYVKPTEPHNVTCPGEPCYTLDEYVSNSPRYFVSNTVFAFLSGYHHLSYNATVSDIHNITLRPYIEKSLVNINSELTTSMVFELASATVISDMTFQTLRIRFENSTNITLSGLVVENNAAVVLNDVFGAVSISNFESKNSYDCISFEWTATQSQYIPNTMVLLQELDLSHCGVSISGCISGNILLRNSTFKRAEGTGMEIELDSLCSDILFVSEHTRFYNNSCIGLLVRVQASRQMHQHRVEVILHNISYVDNGVAVFLDNVRNVTISDCHFERSVSYRGAVTAINSVLSLTGNVTFIDNYSKSLGGAIALSGDSRILIPDPNNTYVLFENNSAYDLGGAIYFSRSDMYETGNCKMYMEQVSSKTVFNFVNNIAINGGNAIYGAYLDAVPCYSPNGTLVQNLSELILNVSSFSPSIAKNNSVISSDAEDMCFCNKNGEFENCSGSNIFPICSEELGDCSDTQNSVYPGQIFDVSVAVIGDMNGLVTWPVHATVVQGNFSSKIQISQSTSAERCTNFQYSILSKDDLAIIKFSLDSLIYSNIFQNQYCVHLLECPIGFALSASGGCECHKKLSQYIGSITCNITELSIERQGTTWIGVLEKNTSNSTLFFSSVCPFGFCNESHIKVRGSDEDIQCTGNRSGVLCGGCRDNFSLALGSNNCLHGCSNNNLSLVIAFAAAGIALVFFIKILNLTVSQGTINGLIFYANIIGVEQSVLFSSRGFLSVLNAFIAWVNLDLGIETCFYNGMNAYAKAWLQFVFPAYVWAIALFIIILSHYSIRASKLFGNNSVPVLATLILLSYSKLLQAVISALSITDIRFLNGSTTAVWARDGNIQYLTGQHIPLFVFAIAVLVLLWFPFTLVLVSIQWLQKGTHYRVLRWVVKLMPFFDAFTGPLKDKHRYWVGALLLARCILLLIFYIYTANGIGVAFVSITFATFLILIYLAAITCVYRKYFTTLLELSYFLNLGILATGTLYVRYINNKTNQEALVMTSVGIAFLQFLATVIYHAYVQLREPLKKLKIKIVGIDGDQDANGPEYVEYSVIGPLNRPPFQEITVSNKFRESLLGYLDD